METPAIRVVSLHKTYQNDIHAVKGLSFTVAAGSCFALLGPNGAGKTTTMKILYGKARPDPQGETVIEVLGFDPRRDELDIKVQTGVVPQDNALDEELDVMRNLLVYARLNGIRGRRAVERIDELLAFMELIDKRNASVRELSGGMKRRLAIARALLNNPRLLILDEPTTGLDPQVRHVIWDKLRSLMRSGVTVLVSTHYMDEAYQLADRILIMDHGEAVLEGHPASLMETHMERHVLEVTNAARASRVDAALDNGNGDDIRVERSAERALYYGNALAPLEDAARQLDFGEYVLRPANLEDLFLKTTGRQLNELQ